MPEAEAHRTSTGYQESASGSRVLEVFLTTEPLAKKGRLSQNFTNLEKKHFQTHPLSTLVGVTTPKDLE